MKIKSEKYEIVTFLRGYSMLAIVLFHYLQDFNLASPFNKMIYFGGTGVHLFVFLSGWGLFYSYKRKPLRYREFLKRRFSKIYVPYIFVVSMTALVSFVIPIFSNSIYAFLGHVFLFKMFDESIMGSYGYPFWFISMILQFYLVFYLIIFVKDKFSNRTFFVLSLITSLSWAFIVFILGKESLKIWNGFFLQFLWEFSLGMIIADNLEWVKKLNEAIFRNKKPVKILCVALVGFVLVLVYGLLAIKCGNIGKLFNDMPALAGFSFLAISLYKINNKFINRFFVFTGTLSFSLYLWHILVCRIFVYFFSANIFSISISLLTCYIISYFFNKLLGRIFS